jgi:hypothetical protein
MKKVTIVSLVVIAFLAGSIVVNEALAKPAKDPVSGTGSSMLFSPNPYVDPPVYPPEGVLMQFSGSVELLVRGELVEADLLVNVLNIIENDEGVQHVSAQHILTFENGSTITTSDKEVAEPTEVPGVYTINATMKVVSGTDDYEGVSGHLTAHGTMDFTGWPAASFELRGAISTSAED